MTDTTAADTTAENTAADEPVLSDVDLFIEKLKELVEAAGSQTHAYFDDLVELAKKLI